MRFFMHLLPPTHDESGTQTLFAMKIFINTFVPHRMGVSIHIFKEIIYHIVIDLH